MEPAKVLIIRFSSIGDIVLTTPVVRQLKQQLVKGSEVHYLTKPQYAHILQANPNIDQVHTLDEDIKVTCDKLKEENFNYVVDLHKNVRSAVVKRHLNHISFTLDKRNIQKWKLVQFSRYNKPVEHIVKRYIETAKPLGAMEDGKGLDYFIPPATPKVEGLPKSPFIAWVLGGAHRGKRLSVDKNKALLSNISYPVVILGGPDEREEGVQLEKIEGVSNLCGQLTLDQSAMVVRQSHLVVTGDTGLMHIASAFGKIIISLWGCTSPVFGMDPYMPSLQSLIIQPSRAKRPCSKLGDRCKYGWDDQCTSHLDEDTILRAIEERMLNR